MLVKCYKRGHLGPCLFGSVGRMSAHRLKGPAFYSGQGPPPSVAGSIPGPGGLVGARVEGNQSMCLLYVEEQRSYRRKEGARDM